MTPSTNSASPTKNRFLPVALVLVLVGAAMAMTPAAAAVGALESIAEVLEPELAGADTSELLSGMGIYFESNLGQFHPDALFKVHGTGITAFLTRTGSAFVLAEAIEDEADPLDPMARFEAPEPVERAMHAVFLNFTDGNPDSIALAKDPLQGISNYFIGNDPTQWVTNVPHAARVVLLDVWPGIDIEWYGQEGKGLKFDAIVHPGADPGMVQFNVDGADNLEVDPEGRLVMDTSLGDLVKDAPYTYQQTGAGETVDVASGYATGAGETFGFEIGDYDSSSTLVIDPLFLPYSTYLGGSDDDYGRGIAVDSSSNAIVTGGTASTNYPTTSGAYQTSNAGGYDMFVTKLSANGASLVYSTYLGGSSGDYGSGVVVDSSGNAIVTGYTESTNYPTTLGAYQTSNAGGYDVFVTKLSTTGSLVYSTYLGGSSGDYGHRVVVDSSGNAYITGYTLSANYPTTSGAYQTSNAGSRDAFVTKLSATGGFLVYSTYLGGSGNEIGYGVAVDSSGNAIVTGYTESTNYPTTSGAYQTSNAGSRDAFVTKLSATGASLVYSTYLGGSNDDHGFDVAVDSSGNAYITGDTDSTNYPTTLGAYQTSYAGGTLFDAFVTKLSATGGFLVYSTYLGASNNENGIGVAVDSSGNAIVTGRTASTNYPTTSGAYQTSNAGDYDVFVTKLSATGASLVYSTYLGGSGSEIGYGVAVDSSGNAYITGVTHSTNYPTTSGAYQTSHAGGWEDVFVTKVSYDSVAPTVSGAPQSWSWRNTIPTLSGITWQDTGSGLKNNVQYSIGTTSGGTNVLGWTNLPTQPSNGQTSSWSPSWNPSTLAQGTNYVNMRVQDVAGNLRQTSGAYTVQYDTNLPTVSGAPQSWSWRNTIPTVSGVSWQDTGSGLRNNVQYSIGTTSGGTNVVGWTNLPTQPINGQTSSWSPSWTPGSLAQGTNYVNMRVEDRTGNLLQTNGAYTVQYDSALEAVTPDPVARTGPGGSLIPANTWQSVNTPRFEWNAPSSTSPIAGYSYTLSTNPSTTPDTVVDTTNTFVNAGPLSSGAWYFKVKAKDEAGNVGNVASFNLLVDTINPVFTSLASMTHVDPTRFYNIESASVTWSASDSHSGVKEYHYKVVDGACPSTLSSPTTTTATSATAALASGFHKYRFCIQAEDHAGNVGSIQSLNLFVDTVKPVYTNVVPFDGQDITDPLQEIRIFYNDFDGGADNPPETIVDVDSVVFRVDGVDMRATWSEFCAPGGLFYPTGCKLEVTADSITYEPLVPWEEGSHNMDVSITDTVAGGGNTETLSTSFFLQCTGSTDADCDRINDDLEHELCSRAAFSDVLIPATEELGHECRDFDDYRAPTMTILVPTSVQPGPDADGDGVPQYVIIKQIAVTVDLESGGLLGTSAAPDVVVDLDDGATGDDSDPNVPVQSIVTSPFPIPTGYELGEDVDGDGVPRWVEVEMSTVVFDRRNPNPVSFQAESPSTLFLDDPQGVGDDQDPNSPATSVVTVPVKVPYDMALGPDEDDDGVPQYVEVKYRTYTFDSRETLNPLSFEEAPSEFHTLDEDDQDPNVPAQSAFTVSVPTNAWHNGDGDDDYVPGSVTVEYTDVTVDRADSGVVSLSQRSETVILDEDDADRDNVVPFNLVDADNDGVPDAMEFPICLIEDQSTPDDGTCTSDLQDYTPPDGRLYPNPWSMV